MFNFVCKFYGERQVVFVIIAKLITYLFGLLFFSPNTGSVPGNPNKKTHSVPHSTRYDAGTRMFN